MSDVTFIRIIEPFYQSHNCALSRPTASNNRNHFTSREEKREIPKDYNIRPWWITESNFLEFYVSMDLCQPLSILMIIDYGGFLANDLQQFVTSNLSFTEGSEVWESLAKTPVETIKQLLHTRHEGNSSWTGGNKWNRIIIISTSFFTYMPPTIAEKIAVKAFPPSVCPFLMKTPAYQNTSAHDMQAIP